ncbi:MAG: leucine-rich repeat domain-containing protein [Paludibacteraceae bacterium]|nr:leucine-rich repeat domain-containing protein [Paludibacteraceae bacterium]
MLTKFLHKSLLRTSILAAASLAFSLEAMAAEVTQNGIKYSLDETTFKATVMENSCYEGVLELPATVSDDSGQQYTVVGIGKDAFLYCEKLTGIVAPNTVTDIGDDAFDSCSGLTEVSFPNVTSVGNYAFYDCESLKKVSFPKATSIGEFAFFNCESLAEVSFPNVTSIEEEVFHGCSNLTSVSFPNVTIIGRDAFYDCPIETITLNQPDISKVDAYVYYDFGMLSNITLYVPAEALTLYKGDEAWSGLGFKSIEPINEFVADGIVYTRIGKDSVEVAAGNCYEGELELPTTVSDESGKQYTVAGIGKNAFKECEKLTGIVAPNTVTYIGGSAFYNCGSLTDVSFPNAKIIGTEAFSDCGSLTDVSFPNATSIEKNAFYNCDYLTELSFPNATSIGGNAFYHCGNLTKISFPNVISIGNNAFYKCKKMANVSFPSAKSIAIGAFYSCLDLTKVTFPNATSIGDMAFKSCSGLTEVSFPNVTSIGSAAFDGCPIETVTLNQPDISKVDAEVYKNFGTLSNITLYVPAEALTLYKGDEAWSGLGFKSIEPINEFVADGIVYTRIGKDSVEVAAGNCYEGELELPATVSDESGKQYTVAGIGKHAFNGCEKLTYIEIPNTVTYIGEEAFQKTGLSSVVVPASVTKMGAQPFHFCENLKEAEILGPVDSLNCTFSECEALRMVTLPGSLKVFGSYAFFNCKSLESITMKQYDPSSLTIKDGTSFGSNKGYGMLNGTKLLVPEGTLDDYKSSTLGQLPFADIQEYMPSYKAKIYYDGRKYELGKISMDKKYSFNYIAVVEEYIYDPNFDLTQSENVIWLMDENQYVANSIRLVDNLPVYFSVGFLANEISYTRTPSIYNEKVEGETGWETLYLPFTAATVTAGGASITPFNYGGKEKTAENISAGNDFWAKEPVMDNENTLYFSHISDAKFEAGMPYIISFPGDGFGKYSLKDQEIVFSNANVNVAATDDLTAGVNCGQYTMAGTCEKLSSEDAANYYLFDVNSNMFQKNTEEGVAPFRCYVQKMGQSSEGGSSSGSNLKSSRGNVVFVGSYEDYMAQQDDNTTLQSNANADQVIIYAQDNNIILVASEPGVATVCNLNGQIIKCVNYQEGLNNLGDFAQGVYLINGVKVIVK